MGGATQAANLSTLVSRVCSFLKVLGFPATHAGVRQYMAGGGGAGGVERLVDFAFFPDKNTLLDLACRPCVRACTATTVALLSPRLTAAARNKAVALARQITREVDAYMRRAYGQSLPRYVYNLAKSRGGRVARLGLTISGPVYNVLGMAKPTREKMQRFILQLVVGQLKAHIPRLLALQAPPRLRPAAEKLLRGVSLEYDMEALQRAVFQQHRKEVRAFLYGRGEDMAPLVATAVHHVIEANNLLAPALRLPSVACSMCSSAAVGCHRAVRNAVRVAHAN